MDTSSTNQYEKMQEEELEVLNSIYEGDSCFKQLGPSTFQYKYGDDGHPHSILLEINWPETYPESPPNINLDVFYNKHIAVHVKEEIKLKLLAEANENIGCAMTFTLIEWTKEHIEELLVNQPLELESCLNELEIDEKPDAFVNKDKERRVQALTKSQKRRQWDRMDGKGEKPRGFDWVDVIKHLSQTGGGPQSLSTSS